MSLTAGSIAFLGYDADGTQRFAIVAVDELPAGTVIYFTDRAWNGTSFTQNNSEGTLAWTVPTGGIASGTVLSFDNVNSNSLTLSAEKAGVSVAGGTVSRSGNGFDIETSNEVLYAYLGTNANTPTTFLGAIANDGFTNAHGSLANTGLTAGTTAVDLGAAQADADFGVYKPAVGGSSFASRDAMLAAINNPANWTVLATNADDSAAFVPFLTNTNSPIENVNFVIDTVAPDAPVFVPGDDHLDLVLNAAEAGNGETFTFTAEVGSTVKMTFTGTEGQLGPLTATATSPGVYTVTLTQGQLASLGEGQFTISAVAFDGVGNASGPGTGTVELDTTAPDAPVFVPGDQHADGVINGTEAGDGETFTFTAEPGSTVSVSFSGEGGSVGPVAATEDAGAPGTFTVALTSGQLASLGEGEVTIAATATDAAGNASPEGTGSVELDTTAPDAPVFVPGDQHADGVINGTEAGDGETFTFTAEPGSTVSVSFSGEGGSVGPLAATEDAGAPGTFTVALTSGQLASLGEGEVTIAATATDAAGNASPEGTGSVELDTTAPDAPVFVPGDQHADGVINGTEAGDGETFTFTAEPGSTVSVSFSGEGGSVGPLTATEDPENPGTFTVDLTKEQLEELGEGPLTISATATDTAGNVSDPSSDEIDVIPCFLTGTRIATPAGEVAVEALQPGDMVLTADGRAVAVRFVGRRTVMPRFAGAEAANPVRIAAGALAENVPARDLFVSPNHGIVVDGVLAFASALVNGTTIAQVAGPGPRFTYHSIETEGHEAILAENCPAETFMDHVPRAAWDNHADYLALHPAEPRIAEMDLPHAKSHRQVPAEIHAMIAERAAALAPRVATAA